MLEKLRNKWGLGPLDVVLVLVTFAIGGSLAGYVAGLLLAQFSIDINWLRIILYVIIVTLVWPLSVISVSIPLGQFRFFKNYLSRMATRIGLLGKRKNHAGS